MTSPDIRWKQRFDNFIRSFGSLESAMSLSKSRPLSDLEKLPGGIRNQGSEGTCTAFAVVVGGSYSPEFDTSKTRAAGLLVTEDSQGFGLRYRF